jgi:hypothetical protein
MADLTQDNSHVAKYVSFGSLGCVGCVQRNEPKRRIPLIEPIVVTLARYTPRLMVSLDLDIGPSCS